MKLFSSHAAAWQKSENYMKQIVLMIIATMLFSFQGVAQQRPFITNIDKTVAPAGGKLSISGINLPTSAANAQVNFGAGKGTVTYASPNGTLLEVTIPGGATFGNVSVTNLTTGLTGYSSEFFTLAFGGTSFLSGAMAAASPFPSSQNGMYDLCTCDFDGNGVIDVSSSHNNDQASRVPVFQNTSTISTLAFATVNLPSLVINEPTLSVTCGDLDGDGLPELLATRAIAGVTPGDIVFVFRNTSTAGAISFASPISLTLPTDAAGNRKNVGRISIIDLDGDGKPEVITTNQVDNQIDAFRNTSTPGSLSFAATPSQFTIGGARSFGLDAKDLNNDGFPEIIASALAQPDIFVLPNRSSPGTIAFGSSITVPVAGNLANLIVGDLNGDGLNDIAATQSVRGEVSVVLNQTTTTGGNIAFGAASVFAVSSGSWGLDLGDMNGDGKLDLVVASTTSTNMTVLANTTVSSQLTFERFNIAAGQSTRNVKVADVNADGKPDLLGTGITNNNLIVIANRNCITPAITPTNATVCVGSNFLLEATKSIGHTYAWQTSPNGNDPWTNQAETSSSLNLSSLAAGDLFVRVTMNSGDGSCTVTSAGSAQFLVTGTPPAAPNLTDPTPICAGETLTLDGTQTGAASYQWSGPNGFTSTQAVLSIPNFAPTNAGIYTFRYRTGECLSAPKEIRAEIKSVPPVAVRYEGNGLFCENATVSLSAASFAGYNYQWNVNGTAAAAQTSTSFTASAAGSYSVQIIDPVTTCSVTSAALTLERKALPVTQFSSVDAICVDVPIDFTAGSTGEAGLTLNYAWDFTNDGTTDATTAAATHTYVAANAGTVTAELTTGYDEIPGCVSALTKTVEVRAVPVVAIDTPDGTEKCPENEVSLEVPNTFASYSWNTTETTPVVSVADAGTYTVTIVDDAQCTIVSTIDVTNFDTSNSISATSDVSVIDEFETAQFTVTGANEILGWDPTTGMDDPFIATPVVTGTYESGDPLNAQGQREYVYIVTALDINNCEVSDSIPLTVIPEETPQAMKSFSPNNDGVDDVWEIENVEFNQDCKLVIYDRRGRAIFERRPYNNDWDGRINGNELEQGVYYFVFICDDATRNQNGSILLFR